MARRETTVDLTFESLQRRREHERRLLRYVVLIPVRGLPSVVEVPDGRLELNWLQQQVGGAFQTVRPPVFGDRGLAAVVRNECSGAPTNQLGSSARKETVFGPVVICRLRDELVPLSLAVAQDVLEQLVQIADADQQGT